MILALGEGSYCETPGNLTDLTIGAPQLKLAEAILATGKPVVLVLVEGRPRIINRIAVRRARIDITARNSSLSAIAASAVADVLFGDVNPSGKLPFTYPRTPNGLINYDHKPFETENTSFGNLAFKPQFAFGEGLSYTTFGYSDLKLNMRIDGQRHGREYGTSRRQRGSPRLRQRPRGYDLSSEQTLAAFRENKSRPGTESHADV